MIFFFSYDLIGVAFLFIIALLVCAGGAIQSIIPALISVFLLVECILAVYFLYRQIKFKQVGSAIVSVITSFACIFISYYVFNGLCNYGTNIGDIVLFLLELVFLGGLWFFLIFCVWIFLNMEMEEFSGFDIEFMPFLLTELITSGIYFYLYAIM